METADRIYNKLKQLGKPSVPSGPNFILTTCLNPNHEDRHPSFSINLESGAGRCFSCGFAISSDYWNTGEMSEEELEEIERAQKYKKLKESYRQEEEKAPTIYLPPKDRDVESGWRGLCQDTIDKLGIYVCDTGAYKNRVIFPMNNYYGNVVAFNTRALGDEKPKYKYSKGIKVNEIIYPMPAPTSYIVLVEGIIDAISMAQDGIPAIMNFGINNTIGKKKVGMLLALGVETIYIALDNDEAGNKGYQGYLESDLQEYFEIKRGEECKDLIQFYSSGEKDYNDFIMGRGK